MSENTLSLKIFHPLYPQDGGPPLGYSCSKCKDVTKTQRGMWAHLRVVHGITKQAKLNFDKRESAA